jgi:N-acetylmuramoyl-L-alanine amidase
MPSVLIETGFLTNPKEENFIGKDLGQNKMANAMFDAFVKYKNKIEGTDSDISETKGEPEKMDKETNTDSEITDDIDKLEKENSGLIFRVQIISSTKNLPSHSSRFKNEKDIYKYFQSGLYKYCAGNFGQNLDLAKNHKIKMRNMGFNGAFVVAFLDGERIGIEKAIKLVEN